MRQPVSALPPCVFTAVLHSPAGIRIIYDRRDVVNVFSEHFFFIFLDMVRFSRPNWERTFLVISVIICLLRAGTVLQTGAVYIVPDIVKIFVRVLSFSQHPT